MSRKLTSFDNTSNKIKRTRSRLSINQSIYDNLTGIYPSTASAGNTSDGEGEDPNQDTGEGEGAFVIKVNGVSPTSSSDGVIVPSSSFTISVTKGNFSLTHERAIAVGNSAPYSKTIGPHELKQFQTYTADFTVGDGFKDYIIYGVVVAKNEKVQGYSKITGIVNSRGGNPSYNTGIVVADVTDSSQDNKYYKDWTFVSTDNPVYMFMIGTVRATKNGSLRRAYVNQILAGTANVGDNLIDPDDDDEFSFKIVDTGNGSVRVLSGGVNTEIATEIELSGKPTQVWLKVNFSEDEVTSAQVVTESGTRSESEDYVLIGQITWDGDSPSIAQGIKGSLSVASCGKTHAWGTLYL